MANPALDMPETAGGSADQYSIRLLIVDDSAVARAVLARMISQNPNFEIVDAVSSAQDALASLSRNSVDVILLDIEMPGRNGIAALPELIEKSGGARILIVSALAEEGAAATIEALTLGAADTLAKPGRGTFGGKFSDILCERLLRLGQRRGDVDVAIHKSSITLDLAPTPLRRRGNLGPVKCLAIGASTGGLHAIDEFLKALPAEFQIPILITQHLPPVFMPYFAEQLRAATGRSAVVVRSGMRITDGTVYIAPGDAHLCVERFNNIVTVRLEQGRAESGCLPSVDPMFASVGAAYGNSAIGVVLSGMGRDGTIGAQVLAEKGAELLVQNSDTSVVWGMPGSIAKAGLATAILPPAAIAWHIASRWRRT